MCLEAIRIGRRTSTVQGGVNVPNGSSGFFVGAAPRRVTLIVNAPPTNRITLSLLPTASLDEGLTVYPGGQPLILTVAEHGDLVTRAWAATSATADQDVSFFEVFSQD